jgi:4-hydroxybenzoate polyprenyltransferase
MISIVILATVFFGTTYVLSLSVIMFFAWLYNCPPARMKTRYVWSNVAIAAPRGGLGITCAYSAFASPFNPVMYVAIFYFALYVFGTNTLKDFADAEYDKKYGVSNFVTVLGQEKAVTIVGIFLVVPWFFLLAAGAFVGISNANFIPLLFSGGMVYLLLSGIDRKSVEGNSMLWVLFYLQFTLMMLIFALARIL